MNQPTSPQLPLSYAVAGGAAAWNFISSKGSDGFR